MPGSSAQHVYFFFSTKIYIYIYIGVLDPVESSGEGVELDPHTYNILLEKKKYTVWEGWFCSRRREILSFGQWDRESGLSYMDHLVGENAWVWVRLGTVGSTDGRWWSGGSVAKKTQSYALSLSVSVAKVNYMLSHFYFINLYICYYK